MNYRELQNALKAYKAEGRTYVKLNARETVLQAEYDRLVEVGFISTGEDFKASDSACISSGSTIDPNTNSGLSVVSNQETAVEGEEKIELDPEIEAIVAESWTEDPSFAIATIATYTVAGFAMVVLWVALISTTVVISGMKCWHWCQKQFADISLQLRYFEPPFELSIPVQTLLVH